MPSEDSDNAGQQLNEHSSTISSDWVLCPQSDTGNRQNVSVATVPVLKSRIRVSVAGPSTVMGQVARPVQTVRPDLSVTELETVFWDKSASSVVVVDADDKDRVGLITRTRFTATMSGRLGYGRALVSRHTAGDVADWSPLVVSAVTPVAEVAVTAMERAEDVRYDDIIVASEQWSIASTAEVTLSLVALLEERATRDGLTGLPMRNSVRKDLQLRCDLASGGKARVALILIRLQGMGFVNDTYGESAGDLVLKEASTQLVSAVRSGGVVGRVGGRTFAVIMTLPPSDDHTAVTETAQIQKELKRCLEFASATLPQQHRPRVIMSAVCSPAAPTSTDRLFRAAEDHIHETLKQGGASAGTTHTR